MASTYVNNLRLEEIGSGEQSGTWGDTTNTNLEIIGQAVAWGTRAVANASTDNITIADGALDADRCLGLKLTGGGQACTVTLLPNTSSKTWFMYNATAAALTFTCGSGANVIIPAGQTKVIATDGLGSGGVVHDLLTEVNFAGDVFVTNTLNVAGDTAAGDDAAIGYTAAEGLILTGQGSTGDVTIKNDADAVVLQVPTGTTNVNIVGALDVDGTTNFAADVTFADGADIITATAGTDNFRAGVGAGDSIASGGDRNIVIGKNAGTALTTGDSNVAIGWEALKTEDTHANNVAIGHAALTLQNAGADAYNVAVGYNAGTAVTTGLQNTFVGGLAGDATDDGDYNVAVGHLALSANCGDSNVAIGYDALLSYTGTGSIGIGSDAFSSLTSGAANVATGFQAGLFATTADNSTFIGYQAGKGITGAKLTGNNNTAVGKDAGLLLQGAAANNTLLGSLAGDNITTGDDNIIIGYGKDAASATGSDQLNIGGWIVGATGQITMPLQPAFYATPSSAQSNLAANDSSVPIAMGTEIFDVGANFASSTFTAPVTGKYQLNLSIYLENVDTAASYILVGIITSNRNYINIVAPKYASDPAYLTQNISTLADMDASDTATLFYQQSGGAAQIDVGADPRASFFQGYLVC